jgi:hypothetical protein
VSVSTGTPDECDGSVREDKMTSDASSASVGRQRASKAGSEKALSSEKLSDMARVGGRVMGGGAVRAMMCCRGCGEFDAGELARWYAVIQKTRGA